MAGGDTDILIFVEDPGAANVVVDLPRALSKMNLTAQIVAAGHAGPYLAAMGGAHDDAGTATAAALMDAYAPRLVLAGTSENPETLGLALIAEAKRRGLASVGFADGPAMADYRFRGRAGDPLAFAPDWVLVPDDATARRFRELGLEPGRVIACGHPYFDRVRDTGRALARRGRAAVRADTFPEAPADGRAVVVFLAEISDGLIPAAFERGGDYTLAGRGGSDRRTDIVLEEVLDAAAPIRPRPYVVLRLHPKNDEWEFAAYAGEIDFISRGGQPLEAVFAADLVIGMTTSLLFEAALMGCPALSVIPRPIEAEWQTGIGLGIVRAVHTRDALRNILPAAIADPARAMGAPAEKVIQFGAIGRMADFLAGLLAEGSRPAGGGDD
jgi:hypothetical protein